MTPSALRIRVAANREYVIIWLCKLYVLIPVFTGWGCSGVLERTAGWGLGHR